MKDPILTQEERDVLLLATQKPSGKHRTNREIGQHLGISVTRVKTIIHQACVKLEAPNRNKAIWNAIRQGEISITELLSLDEFSELLSSLGSDALRKIADLMRQEELGLNPYKDERIIRGKRRKDGVLTNRERNVLALAAYGLSNQEIAERLFMSISAVSTFFYRASKKLGAHKRTDAVVFALKRREISIGEISTLDEFVRILGPLGAESIEKMAQILDEKNNSSDSPDDRDH